MRRFRARFSESEVSNHTPYLADFTTTTPELKFPVHTTWSNDGGHPARDGEPSCVTTRRTLPPWTCSLFQLSVSTCSMPSSSSGSTAETWSGLTSQQIPRQNGLHVK